MSFSFYSSNVSQWCADWVTVWFKELTALREMKSNSPSSEGVWRYWPSYIFASNKHSNILFKPNLQSVFKHNCAESVSNHNTDAEDCFKFLFLTFVQEDWAF